MAPPRLFAPMAHRVRPAMRRHLSFLAYRTKERGAAVLIDAPDGARAAAGRAAAALAVVDAKFVLKAPELAVGTPMVAQRGAAGRNRVLEHLFDRRDQAFGMGRGRRGARRQRRGFSPRRKPGAVERLAHIDVAESGHHLLVEQRGFESRRLAGAGSRKRFRREG